MAIGLTQAKNVTILSSQSVASDQAIDWASDVGGTVLNAADTERFQEVNIQVSVTFDASATGDVEIHTRKSVDDGTTEDTGGDETLSLIVPVSAGNTVNRTFSVYNFNYLDLGAKNLDTSYSATVSAQYDGLKLTGLAT